MTGQWPERMGQRKANNKPRSRIKEDARRQGQRANLGPENKLGSRSQEKDHTGAQESLVV